MGLQVSILRKIIREFILDEAYPEAFDMEHFKSLNDFDERLNYANDHLKHIGGGSAREVFKIDDEKCLKVASNSRGIAQNKVEYVASQDGDFNDLFAKIYDRHPNNLWNEMELARKLEYYVWEKIVGLEFDVFNIVLADYYYKKLKSSTSYPNELSNDFSKISKEVISTVYNSQMFKMLVAYIQKYNVPIGDLTQIDSYGLVKRDGNYSIVMIDYGMTWDVYDEYYK
jgi:hypothetical protein